MNVAQIKQMAHSLISNGDWADIVTSVFSTTFNKTGVCCFGKDASNVLMWSHYCESHKGFILKFDVLSNPEFFLTPLNVQYQKDYPIYNHLRDSKDIVHKLIRTKSLHWKYEKEVRIVKASHGLHEFNKNALREIIFGCRCLDSDKKEIIKIAKESGYKNLKFSQAEVHENSYKIKVGKTIIKI